MSDPEYKYVHPSRLVIVSTQHGVSPFLLCVEESALAAVGSTFCRFSLDIEHGELFYNDKDDFGESNSPLLYKVVVYEDKELRKLRVDLHQMDSEDPSDAEQWRHITESSVNCDEGGEGMFYMVEEYAKKLMQSPNVPDMVFLGELPPNFSQPVQTCVGVVGFKFMEGCPPVPAVPTVPTGPGL